MEVKIKTYEEIIRELEIKQKKIHDEIKEISEFCEKNKDRIKLDMTIILESDSLGNDIATIKELKKQGWKLVKYSEFNTIKNIHFFNIEKSIVVVDMYMIKHNIVGDVMIIYALMSNVDMASHIKETDSFKISLNNVVVEVKAKHSTLKEAEENY